MAKYDHGGGCGCGLEKECPPECEWYRSSGYEKGYDAVKETVKETRKIRSKQNTSIQKENTNMSLKAKLIKNSTVEFTASLEDSVIYTHKDMIPTPVIGINIALSGMVDGGITPGVTMFAGPSKHFKTGFALLMAKSFLNKYSDGIILFYDSEFGTPQGYFKTFGIPLDSVVHTPITDVEELKHDISVQLQSLTRQDKVMIIVDSIGNLASRKENDDALEGKNVSDMTRAKQLKSLFRMITAKLTLKDIPLIAINHIYMTMEMYSKAVVGGGTGSYYGADNIWIIGRQQDKDDKEIVGYHYVINIEKSRYVKEKSKIPITISFEDGINKWSGLLDLAVEAGYIVKPKNGWYARCDKLTGEIGKNYRAGDINDNSEFWKALFSETDFADWIKNKYTLGSGKIMEEDDA
jgi:RecA/RadA recombinase